MSILDGPIWRGPSVRGDRVERTKELLRQRGQLSPLVADYLDGQAEGIIPDVDLPAEATGEQIKAYLDTLDKRKKRERVNQTVRRMRDDSLKIGPQRPKNKPKLKKYFENPQTEQAVPRVGSDGDLTLQPADGRGDGQYGYVHLRPGTEEFTKKYVPPGERIIEQIRLGEDERLETAYVSGRTGEPLKRKPKRLPR